ncbi:MAG: hypothetical protein DI565_03320 [Ancylobacter novellus]|uniref:Uncharacterized protein n=1 Tax=Ancylobacter novellus TaxID=921 RepID=A0A2W5MJK1_ANCNO|nr:MAG: hypothetical protein DI565_03320 [Ancylobacter novellus]
MKALALAFGTAASLCAAASAAEPPTAPKADVFIFNQSLIYNPVVWCRAFDTTGSRKKLTTSWRTFFIAGTTGFETQGGAEGGCGVPSSAASVVIALTRPSGDIPMALRARAYDLSSSFWQTFNVAPLNTSSMTLPIKFDRIEFRTNTGSTDIYGDIVGYFAPQLAAQINADGSIYSGTARVTGAAKIETGRYRVTFDRKVVGCAVTVNVPGGYSYGSGFVSGDNTVDTSVWSTTSKGAPAPADLTHHVVVHC